MTRSLLSAVALSAVCAGALLVCPGRALASDHADPISLKEPESNLTDLFFFPKDDQMILIIDARRSLTSPGPYNLTPFDYVVHMDLHSAVTYDNPSDVARYGGTVMSPEGLKDDVTITIHLNNDATVKDKTFAGLKNPDQIRLYTGLRDDPFIFPRFFKKNVIAMVMSIPMSSFPEGQKDFILWATTHKDGKQIDHDGRSNRSQQARFDGLNTVPPSQQVAALMKSMESRGRIYDVLRKYRETKPLADILQFTLNYRKYDIVPDVVIYSNRFPAGFPNGRRLEDDVAAITCATGDCILQELALIEAPWPRAVTNDKAFTPDFPFLANPWPDTPEAPPLASVMPMLIMGAIILFLVVFALGYLAHWYRSRLTQG